jgi:uncharacterized alkaline shock family protein YloU
MDKNNAHELMRESGAVRISDEVVAVIAGLAASEVEGVAGMGGGGLAGSVSEMLGKKNLTKGVKVQVGEKQVVVDLFIIIEHGARIPVVARKVQENVKNAIANMTGLEVVEANVHVQGVFFPDAKSEDTAKTK